MKRKINRLALGLALTLSLISQSVNALDKEKLIKRAQELSFHNDGIRLNTVETESKIKPAPLIQAEERVIPKHKMGVLPARQGMESKLEFLGKHKLKAVTDINRFKSSVNELITAFPKIDVVEHRKIPDKFEGLNL